MQWLRFLACLLFVGERVKTQLLVSKKYSSSYFIENKPFTVIVLIKNIGKEPVEHVDLLDLGFNTKYFILQDGEIPMSLLTKFEAGSILELEAEFVCVKAGKYFDRPAIIAYMSKSGESSIVGSTSRSSRLLVFDREEYHQRFEYHFWEWVIFCLLMASLVWLPWWKSQRV